eukprot:359263-Chlamydomonas_euryale.AAC.4
MAVPRVACALVFSYHLRWHDAPLATRLALQPALGALGDNWRGLAAQLGLRRGMLRGHVQCMRHLGVGAWPQRHAHQRARRGTKESAPRSAPGTHALCSWNPRAPLLEPSLASRPPVPSPIHSTRSCYEGLCPVLFTVGSFNQRQRRLALRAFP